MNIQQEALKNPQMPAEILRNRAQDEDILIRYSIALNTNTPTEILRKYAVDENPFVRVGIVLNSSTPDYLITILGNDKEERVRKRVKERMEQSKRK